MAHLVGCGAEGGDALPCGSRLFLTGSWGRGGAGLLLHAVTLTPSCDRFVVLYARCLFVFRSALLMAAQVTSGVKGAKLRGGRRQGLTPTVLSVLMACEAVVERRG